MIRRCPAPLTAMMAALVFGLGSQPIATQADGISSSTAVGTANYTLTTPPNGPGLPAPTVPVPGTSLQQLDTLTNGSAAVAATNTSELAVGDPVKGTGIPAGDTISKINTDGSGFTLSQNATVSGPEALNFTSVPSPQVVALIEPAGGVVIIRLLRSTQGPLHRLVLLGGNEIH